MKLYRIMLIVLTWLISSTVVAENIGRVKLAEGDAHVLRGEEQIMVQSGMRIQALDRVVTGRSGRLGITFVDNSILSLGPNTTIDLDTFDFNPTTHDGAFHTRIEHGTLSVVSGQIAKKSEDAMTVSTPASILGVRGTEFLVKVR